MIRQSYIKFFFTLLPVIGNLLLSITTVSADEVAVADYDAHLCSYAQQFLLNAAPQAFPIIEQIGYGNGFHVIQMDVDAEQRQVTIAMTSNFTRLDDKKLTTYVACKTVDRARVNDVLGLQLPGPEHQCRDVNEQTYDRALQNLSEQERAQYLTTGRQLTFADDAYIATGGEWLPITMDAFIQPAGEAGNDLAIQSPSVRVPWNPEDRQFFQGTRHCKLITLAAMERWMRIGAFSKDTSLFPPDDSDCTQPNSMTSTVGSCLFYFAPANAMFCQDYSGAGWSRAAAQEECTQRHASAAALRAAKNRYAGAGGLFNAGSCTDRDDAPELNGTCVFHCRQSDETLWHVTGPTDPRMTRACDLFVPR